jgi:two-component system, OmpR family, response regulator
MRVLLIEDDRVSRESLQIDLQRAGFVVDTADNGETAEFMGSTENYDIALLDLGLPKLSGIEVLRRWRAANNPVPVIVLTARDAWHEKVDGFKAGADDYLGKPFHIEELLARISAVLRRSHGQMKPQLECYGLSLDEERQIVTIDNERNELLTGAEFRLLRCFMLHRGKTLSKSHICEHIYKAENNPDSNTIEVYINHLRQKLGKDLIHTRRGQGYLFGDPL